MKNNSNAYGISLKITTCLWKNLQRFWDFDYDTALFVFFCFSYKDYDKIANILYAGDDKNYAFKRI